jgi:bisphosphoglycerate-independent phosphoglycerate mutase (AlkP superfamily)
MIKIIPTNIRVCLHLFADGRDLPRNSMYNELNEFLEFLKNYENIEITTIS